ncbi:MAG: hypothetical protein ACI965_001057 [Paraglaciecola sp.]|jgi:hypothetical protein
MTFIIIIVLIVSLLVIAIIVNAIQQHKKKVETEIRSEIAKQKSIVDYTENTIMATQQIPVTQRLLFILHRRVFNALKGMQLLNPGIMDIGQRIRITEEMLKEIKVDQAPPPEEAFQLPSNDKQVIQFIKGIKNMRTLLRSEHRKSHVDRKTFESEDKLLERMQLRSNVDTLMRRGEASLAAHQLGSARQSMEKAIAALASQPNPDDYIIARKGELEDQLRNIRDSLRNANSNDVLKKQESERDEIDELFGDKKKW